MWPWFLHHLGGLYLAVPCGLWAVWKARSGFQGAVGNLCGPGGHPRGLHGPGTVHGQAEGQGWFWRFLGVRLWLASDFGEISETRARGGWALPDKYKKAPDLSGA